MTSVHMYERDKMNVRPSRFTNQILGANNTHTYITGVTIMTNNTNYKGLSKQG